MQLAALIAIVSLAKIRKDSQYAKINPAKSELLKGKSLIIYDIQKNIPQKISQQNFV